MMIEGIIVIVCIALGAFMLGYMFHDALDGWKEKANEREKQKDSSETSYQKNYPCRHSNCNNKAVGKYGVNYYCERHLELRRGID